MVFRLVELFGVGQVDGLMYLVIWTAPHMQENVGLNPTWATQDVKLLIHGMKHLIGVPCTSVYDGML